MDEMEKLAYQNRFVRQLVQTLENYSEADCEGKTPQIISGDDNLVILRVSLDEWTKLTSSVFTGADICYPDESDSVRWTLFRAVECPVDLCALIANCIATSETTQAAIRNFILSDPAISEHIAGVASEQTLSLLERERNLLKPEACEPGFIFNQTSVMVQLLHDLTEDLFEAIEVGTNALERATIVTSAIPIFGQVVPADELLSFVDGLVEEVAEDYSGAYDEALYDSIRCDLFCLVQDDCTLSIDRAIAYYENKVGEEFPDDPWQALQAIISFLNVGDFGTDVPVYAMHLLVLALIRQMQTVFGVDFGILGLRVTAAGDESNNDWEILCDECEEPVETRTPVINSEWDPANIAGTLSGPDSEGFYTVTATSRGTDWAGVIMDIEGRPFVLEGLDYPTAQSACQVIYNDPTMIYIGCDFTNHYVAQTVTEFWSTWTNAQGQHTFKFKMVPPSP